MIIGVPKEIKDDEYRVALLPSAAYQLIKRGHQMLVGRGAGVGAGYPDADYEQAGATLVADSRQIFEKADLIVKVKEPQPSEYPLLRRGQILFTYLHLAAEPALARALEKLEVPASLRPLAVNPAAAHLFIVNPLKGVSFSGLFSTHPPIAERVRRLRQMELGVLAV